MYYTYYKSWENHIKCFVNFEIQIEILWRFYFLFIIECHFEVHLICLCSCWHVLCLISSIQHLHRQIATHFCEHVGDKFRLFSCNFYHEILSYCIHNSFEFNVLFAKCFMADHLMYCLGEILYLLLSVQNISLFIVRQLLLTWYMILPL